MEYVSGGELFQFVEERGRLSEYQAAKFLSQLLDGVEYLHQNRIYHRDLKLENILLDKDYNIKITDFGLANMCEEGHTLRTACGTPYYIAPEVCLGQAYHGSETDIWSCGIIFYMLLTRKMPYENTQNIAQLCQQIVHGHFDLPNYLSESCQDLLCGILCRDPTARFTIPQIRKHSFMRTMRFYKNSRAWKKAPSNDLEQMT
jgi:serine/threonine protein kinase